MNGWVIFSLMAFSQLVSGMPLNATIEDRTWENEFKQTLSYECDPGQHIYRWKSQYSAANQDRMWDFECKQGLASRRCYWTNYVNSYDGVVNKLFGDSYEEAHVMVGVSSTYSHHHKDRIWKFKLCEVTKGTHWTDISRVGPETVYINVYAQDMDYSVPQGKAIVGVFSFHKNHYDTNGGFPIPLNDRMWFLILVPCTECLATTMKILKDDFLPRPIGTKVVAIGTMPVCTQGAKGTLSVSRTRGLSQSVSVTTSTSKSFAIGTSLTIEAMVGVSVKAFESSLTLGFTASTESTETWGTETTEDETEYTEDTVEGSIEIYGISGGYITGLVDEYQFDKSEIPVEYKYRCSTDTPDVYNYATENSSISLRGHVFGHVHFDNHLEAWNSKEECEQNKACLRRLNTKLALTPIQLMAEFQKCFPGST